MRQIFRHLLALLPFCLAFSLMTQADDRVHAPTIYLEKTPPAPAKTPKPKLPVLIDARPAFDFAMGHFPGAILLRWQDYSQTENPHQGGLDPDSDLLGRKLRYLGISPQAEVIVEGNGPKGKGEEGRVAWMLTYLGVDNVKVHNITNENGRKTTTDTPTPESAPYWIPKIKKSLRMTKSDVDRVLSAKDPNSLFLDVRSTDDFKKKHIDGAVNIPWVNFLSAQGEAASKDEVLKTLSQAKITPDKTLIVYSQDGVASGYVTFILYRAGLGTAHYDGSFHEFFNE